MSDSPSQALRKLIALVHPIVNGKKDFSPCDQLRLMYWLEDQSDMLVEVLEISEKIAKEKGAMRVVDYGDCAKRLNMAIAIMTVRMELACTPTPHTDPGHDLPDDPDATTPE